MNKGKIIQIIPNNKELYAYRESEGSCDYLPLVCFALVERCNKYTGKTYRIVEPMFLDVNGQVDNFEIYTDFKEIRNFKS